MSIDHQTALIYTMIIASAADGSMTDAEMDIIGDIVGHLPIFQTYDLELLPKTASNCAALLQEEDGLDTLMGLIKRCLSDELVETAYALACDVTAADGSASQEELRFLEILRDTLSIDRLHAAAIERGARARFRRLMS